MCELRILKFLSSVKFALVKALLLNADLNRAPKYFQIKPYAPVVAIFLVKFHLFHKRNIVSAVDLRPAGKPRTKAVNAVFKAKSVCAYLA